jgi:hypothetical protein
MFHASVVSSNFSSLCEQLYQRLGKEKVTVWAAGQRKPANLPKWIEVQTLTAPLRCPPKVHHEVQKSGWIDGKDVPKYTDDAVMAG